jgi:hypothetical protein
VLCLEVGTESAEVPNALGNRSKRTNHDDAGVNYEGDNFYDNDVQNDDTGYSDNDDGNDDISRGIALYYLFYIFLIYNDNIGN